MSAIERVIVPGGIERRALGRTGETLSIIAFGGIVLNGRTPEYAARLVRDAFEAGITHFDVAPQYGSAEELLGPALAPFRAKVFLSCKTLQRGREGAGDYTALPGGGRAVARARRQFRAANAESPLPLGAPGS